MESVSKTNTCLQEWTETRWNHWEDGTVWDTVRRNAFPNWIKNPDAITSTKLRKYIATITQVLSLEEKELDWLARHLGHDIRTHREYYRLHESTIEIAKISKLLLAVDSGKAGSLKGKSLEEIAIDGELWLNAYGRIIIR